MGLCGRLLPRKGKRPTVVAASPASREIEGERLAAREPVIGGYGVPLGDQRPFLGLVSLIHSFTIRRRPRFFARSTSDFRRDFAISGVGTSELLGWPRSGASGVNPRSPWRTSVLRLHENRPCPAAAPWLASSNSVGSIGRAVRTWPPSRRCELQTLHVWPGAMPKPPFHTNLP